MPRTQEEINALVTPAALAANAAALQTAAEAAADLIVKLCGDNEAQVGVYALGVAIGAVTMLTLGKGDQPDPKKVAEVLDAVREMMTDVQEDMAAPGDGKVDVVR